ncbi:hypothetical protein AVEN_178857-1 [Araneus ventricosus]|uniref:Uncharacterized protein n=1 Tax=Araneus ventricosus TaxID=182803 RepID=A0A4Y2BDY7_ARAVE|nr:hypothetical protein AVEN_178857-1 [Araneus ventricosus]
MHARSANIASSVEFGLPSEIVTAVEIVDDRLTGLYRSQVLHQAKTPPKGNFSSLRLLTKAPSDHSNRERGASQEKKRKHPPTKRVNDPFSDETPRLKLRKEKHFIFYFRL